ncbi:SH3 domain-containing protein [Rhodobacterales bacterium HKCCE3408]|nr:SH3 domain-containing protein [Rhodobacterales bacterium HKCCE3408]
MRPAVVALALIAVDPVAAQGIADAGPDIVVVAGEGINLRTGPSTEDARVTRLDQGTVLLNLGCEAFEEEWWCQVEATDGAYAGWISGRFLVDAALTETPATTPLVPTQTRQVEIAADGTADLLETLAEDETLALVFATPENRVIGVDLLGSSGPIRLELRDPEGTLVFSVPDEAMSFEGLTGQGGDFTLLAAHPNGRSLNFRVAIEID